MLQDVAFGGLHDSRVKILDCAVIVLGPKEPREREPESLEKVLENRKIEIQPAAPHPESGVATRVEIFVKVFLEIA